MSYLISHLIKINILQCTLLLVSFFIINQSYANCSNPSLTKTLTEDFTHPVRVIKEGSVIYSHKNGNDSTSKAEFNKRYYVENASSERIQVGNGSSGSNKKVYGWIDKKNLLCSIKSIQTERKLAQRIFIKTDFSFKDDKEFTEPYITAYKSPESEICAGKCRQLSHLSGHFIYDKRPIKNCKNPPCYQYLIANRPNLEVDDLLTGWVHSDHTFLWTTAYGLRPSEALSNDEFICGYPAFEDAVTQNKQQCIKILGGWRWLQSSTRLHLIDVITTRKESFYKVITTAPTQFLRKKDTSISDEIALLNALKKEQANPKNINIPKAFFEQLISEHCKTVALCRNNVIETPSILYIRKDENIVLDVFMDADKFTEMHSFFSQLATFFKENSEARIEDSGQRLKAVLFNSLQTRLNYGELTDVKKIELEKKTLSRLINYQLGIPFDKTSPLFNRKLNDYKTLDPCEREHLIEWTRNYTKILTKIDEREIPVCNHVRDSRLSELKDDQVVNFLPPICGRTIQEVTEEKKRVTDDCPALKDFLPLHSVVKGYQFPEDNISYFSSFKDEKEGEIIWIPEQFLP